MVKEQVGQLLQKEMDRKDFLKHVGVAAAVIIGIPTLLKTLSQLQAAPTQQSPSAVKAIRGYGLSAYGGK